MDNATNLAAQLTELSYAVDTLCLLATGALVIKLTLGIRVAEQHEYFAVDRSKCGLEACPKFTRD